METVPRQPSQPSQRVHGARGANLGVARGAAHRSALCTSVTVIGLFLAEPKERMKMEKNRGCDSAPRSLAGMPNRSRRRFSFSAQCAIRPEGRHET
eukprot:scaffold4827_cov109-Isochrysis_galbana.AAC.12